MPTETTRLFRLYNAAWIPGQPIGGAAPHRQADAGEWFVKREERTNMPIPSRRSRSRGSVVTKSPDGPNVLIENRGAEPAKCLPEFVRMTQQVLARVRQMQS